MSSSSKPPSSASDPSSSSRVSQCPSIQDVISTLRSSFRHADFDAAQNHLLSREAKLRRQMDDIDLNWRFKYDILDTEFNDLRLEKLQWEAQRDRLTRELKVAQHKLSDLDMDLRTSKEKEKKANERCGEAYKDINLMLTKNQELLDKCNKEEAVYRQTLDSLRNEGEQLRKQLRHKEERINELLRQNEELLKKEKTGMEAMADVKQLMNIRKENDEKIKELKGKVAAQLAEIREKDERIDKLLKNKQSLQMEVEDLRAYKNKDDDMVEKLSELESLVTIWMCNVPNDINLRDTQVGEILSKFNKFLDSENAAVCLDSKVIRDGIFDHGDSTVASGTNKPKQQVNEHLSVVLPGATLNKVVDIVNLDSESSSEETLHHQLLKRKLSDCTLNPKSKIKKFNDVTDKSVKVERFTPSKQTVSTVRKCSENSMDEGNIQDNGTSAEAKIGCSPDMKKLLDTCRRNKGSVKSVKQGA